MMASPDELVNGSVTWALTNREKILRFAFIAQLVVGLVFVALGYAMGKDHFRLIRHGVRADGKIVSYREKYFGSNSSPTKSTLAFMPIVEFQINDRVVQFQDWKGTNVATPNQRVVVVYDPANPMVAMIDRPAWNWIPWAPTFGLGVFLLLVGIMGGLRAMR